jgi:sulfofructose kinase
VKRVDVVVIGENSWDLVAVVPEPPQANAKIRLTDFREFPGGEATTAAVGLARLGCRTKYIGRFGDDRFGVLARERLAAEGVDLTDAIIVGDQTTRLAVILVDQQSGDRTVLWRRDDALALRPDDLPDRVLRDARALLVGSDDVDAMTSAAARARQSGVTTFGDLERVHPGTDDLLRTLDVIVMAAEFPGRFTGRREPGSALREIAAQSSAAFVCVTLGREGCLALVNGREFRIPAFNVPVVDTTGAGDLFRAGLIARWLGSGTAADPVDLLRYASAAAALNCRALGAQTAAPRREEVEALLRA